MASKRTEQAPYDGPPSAVPGTGRPNTDKREREASLHVAQEFGDKAAAALPPAKTDHLRTLIARGGIENALAVIGVMDFGGNALASSLVVGGACEMALALKQNGALQHHVLLRAAGVTELAQHGYAVTDGNQVHAKWLVLTVNADPMRRAAADYETVRAGEKDENIIYMAVAIFNSNFNVMMQTDKTAEAAVVYVAAEGKAGPAQDQLRFLASQVMKGGEMAPALYQRTDVLLQRHEALEHKRLAMHSSMTEAEALSTALAEGEVELLSVGVKWMKLGTWALGGAWRAKQHPDLGGGHLGYYKSLWAARLAVTLDKFLPSHGVRGGRLVRYVREGGYDTQLGN
jgi:hypothetical protein